MLETVALTMLISPFVSSTALLLIAFLNLILAYLKRPKDLSVVALSIILIALINLGLSKILISTAIFTLLAHRFVKKSTTALALYTILAFAYIYYWKFFGLQWSLSYILLLSLMAGLSASLMESLRVENKPILILLAVSTTLTVFHIYMIETQIEQIFIAFTVSFLLSLMALKAKVADESGLMSATLIGVTVIVFSDFRFFAVLLSFYMLGSAITKYKYSLKLQRGIAEQAGGARGFANVFSNSLPALFFVMNYGVLKLDAFATAFTASVATALGDTMASEVGKTADEVYLITNFKRVKAGESGGISVIGEFAGFVGCLIVSALAFALGVVDLSGLFISTLIGFVGVHVDSILGATLEKRGLLNNAGVNLLATLSSGVFAFVVHNYYC